MKLSDKVSLRSDVRAYVSLGLGIIILGFSAIFIRLANAPGIVTAFYRMAIATVVLTIPFFRHVKSLRNPLSRRGIRIGLLAGIFFGFDLSLWASGIMLSGATTPTLMANTAPLWVGLGSWLLFREKQSSIFWIGLILAMLGASVVLGQDMMRAFNFGLGTFLGLLAAIAYGAYQLATQRGRVSLDTLSYFWISALSSSLLLLVLVLIFKQPLLGYNTFTYLNFLAVGLIVQLIGWMAINYAQGYFPASIVAPTLLGQPVLTAIIAGILLGESFTHLHIIGGIAVIIGIYIIHSSQWGAQISNPKHDTAL